LDQRLWSWDQEGKKKKQGPDGTALFIWLREFHQTLAAKLGLYFHAAFAPMERVVPAEGERWGGWRKTDSKEPTLVETVESFVRRVEGATVSILLDMNSVGTPFSHAAYVPQHDAYQQRDDDVDGLARLPIILSIPSSVSLVMHHPGLVCLMMDEATVLSHYAAAAYYYDKGTNTTYYLVRVEASLTLAVTVIGSKKAKLDKTINDFLSAICSTLRNQTVLAMLSQ